MASSPSSELSGTGASGSPEGTSTVPCTDTEKESWVPWTVPSMVLFPNPSVP